jgi:hypothetical protein
MTAPRVVLGLLDHTGTHRIEMNVRREFKQVGVGIYENSFIPSLKEMTTPLLPPVNPASIAEGEVLDDT